MSNCKKIYSLFILIFVFSSCSTSPKPMPEKFDIVPIIGEQQRLRLTRGSKFIDFIDGRVILSCNLHIEDRTGINSAFSGNTFVLLFGMENIDYPVIELDERNIHVFGKNDESEEWIQIKKYSADETYRIWENGKNIMWTFEGQMNYLRQINEIRDTLLYSNSIYRGQSYAGHVKADFVDFKRIKVTLLVNQNSLDEIEVEYLFELNRIK